MTRVLSELLGAAQPRFTMTIRDLERAAGNPSTDIRLSSELNQRVLVKLKELGLDPHDTTERELYRVLHDKLANDETTVRAALAITENASSTAVLQAIEQYIAKLPIEYGSFSLKASVAKRLMKKTPPKRTMKQLNYRSLESFLKHEHIAHVYVAAFLCESTAWRKKFTDQYMKLQPGDFESRKISISIPQANRWKELSNKVTSTQRHNIIVVKELGAVVILPLEKSLPGLAITSLVLTLNALNDIVSTGSFLKLQQVRQDFGAIVRKVSIQEPMTSARLVDRQVPWSVVHQYYARHTAAYNPVLFEPHIQSSDLQWQHPESILSDIDSSLKFWHDTRYTSFFRNKEIISLNVLDAALNYCNKLPYAERMRQFAKQHLWHELMVRYLNQVNVEHAISGELTPHLEFVSEE
jgi:hypothetical protein